MRHESPAGLSAQAIRKSRWLLCGSRPGHMRHARGHSVNRERVAGKCCRIGCLLRDTRHSQKGHATGTERYTAYRADIFICVDFGRLFAVLVVVVQALTCLGLPSRMPSRRPNGKKNGQQNQKAQTPRQTCIAKVLAWSVRTPPALPPRPPSECCGTRPCGHARRAAPPTGCGCVWPAATSGVAGAPTCHTSAAGMRGTTSSSRARRTA